MTDAAVASSPSGGRARRWLSVLLALLVVGLGGLGGWAVYQSLPPTYSASTTVLVLPTATGLDSSVAGARSAAEVQIETEAELLQSAEVAAAAEERVNGTLTAKQLLRDSTVLVPPNSQVLVVSLDAVTPTTARNGSMALAEAYLERRESQAETEVSAVVESLQTQLEDLTARLEETSQALGEVPTDNQSQRFILESQRSLLVDQVADVNSRLTALSTQSPEGGQIVSEASLPDRPTSPDILFTVGAGLALGALVAGGLVLLLGQLRSRRRAAGHQPTTSRVPVLATLALSSTSADPEEFQFVDEDEVLRRLCMRIATFKGVDGPTVIAGVGDPLLRTRVGTSLNQAWAAEFGSSVLVVTEPGDHVAATGLPDATPGLRDALRRERSIVEGVTVPVGTYAGVVGPGRDAFHAPSAAERGMLPEMWPPLEREFGAVLIQTGSPLDSPLAQSVAQTAGRFVVLVEVGVGQRRDLTSTLEEIEWLDLSDRVAGVVIVSNHPAPVMSETDVRIPPIESSGRPTPRGRNATGATRE